MPKIHRDATHTLQTYFRFHSDLSENCFPSRSFLFRSHSFWYGALQHRIAGTYLSLVAHTLPFLTVTIHLTYINTDEPYVHSTYLSPIKHLMYTLSSCVRIDNYPITPYQSLLCTHLQPFILRISLISISYDTITHALCRSIIITKSSRLVL